MSLQKSQVERRSLIASMDPRVMNVGSTGAKKQGNGWGQGWIGCVKCCMSSFEHTSQSFVVESEDTMT